VQNAVAKLTRHPGFSHLWCRPVTLWCLKEVPILSPWQNKNAGTFSFIAGKMAMFLVFALKQERKRFIDTVVIILLEYK